MPRFTKKYLNIVPTRYPTDALGHLNKRGNHHESNETDNRAPVLSGSNIAATGAGKRTGLDYGIGDQAT
jgi:hypothetical protein